MPEFSRRKIVTHCLHIDNAIDNEGIIMIIGCDLMVKLNLKANFSRQVLEWDEAVVPMKEPGNFLGQPDLTKIDIREVVMHTV